LKPSSNSFETLLKLLLKPLISERERERKREKERETESLNLSASGTMAFETLLKLVF